mgnify:CR=1 FL=1
MKNIITIPSNCYKNVHSIANQHYDIEIDLTKFHYAVVYPSFYNCNFSRHKTKEAAIKDADTSMMPTVIDSWGNCYDIVYGELQPIEGQCFRN